jgi:hypothetical protein
LELEKQLESATKLAEERAQQIKSLHEQCEKAIALAPLHNLESLQYVSSSL